MIGLKKITFWRCFEIWEIIAAVAIYAKSFQSIRTAYTFSKSYFFITFMILSSSYLPTPSTLKF